MKTLTILMILIAGIFVACEKGPDNDGGFIADCSVPKSFSTDVVPLMQAYCQTGNCHGTGDTAGPGELVTYQQVFTQRMAIKDAVSNGSMPLYNTLTGSQKAKIVCWIDSGAPNN
jgi:hypothetical protein